MRSLFLGVAATLFVLMGGTGEAFAAGWRVTDDGAAIVETDGSTSLSLRCDNNAMTGNKPSWLIEARTLTLRSHGPRMQMVFRFDRQKPVTVMGDNRNGHVALDGLTMNNQSDLQTLVRMMKGASRVSITLIDDRNGLAMPPMTFTLAGSGKAIGAVERACRH